MGDLDADGTADLVVGVPGAVGSHVTGDLYALLMNPDRTVRDTYMIVPPPTLSADDRFGQSVANVGDLDGDGVTDIAAGAPGATVGPTGTGGLYVMLMNADGSAKRTTLIDDRMPNGPATLAAGDRFGWSVANVGDLDRDGVTDIAAGAPGAIVGFDRTPGKVYVMFLNADGTVKRTAEISGDTPNVPPMGPADNFGIAVASIGDLDGDGTVDIGVGSSSSNAGPAKAGNLLVLFMNPDGTVKRTAQVNSQTPNGPSTLAAADTFGEDVAGIGDLDGDDIPDIAAGAPHSLVGPGDDTGRLYVMLMNADGTVKRTVEVNASTPNGPSLVEHVHFGKSVANVGDLDGDGLAEIAVGTYGDDTLHIISMGPDGSVRDAAAITTRAAGLLLLSSEQFGVSVTGIGDLDGDGVPDIAAGASGHLVGGISTGELYVMFLNADGTVKRTAAINADTPNGPPGLGVDDRFGQSVENLGDLDGDGLAEIAAGATGHVAGASGTGELYVMFLNADGTVKRTAAIDSRTPNGPSGLGANDRFGESVARIGDLDGDGVTEMAVGAPGHTSGGRATGDLYVLFLNADGTVKRTVEVNAGTPNGPSLAGGDRFGTSVAGIGDLDGDDIPDIAAGATGHLVGGAVTGDLYVMFLNADGTVKRTAEINSQSPNGPDLESGDVFGASVENVGDLDGDGLAEIAVGAPGHVVGGSGSGDLYVLFLNADGTVKRTAEVNAETPNGPSLAGVDRFGSSVAAVGDLDGDGAAEIAIGAPASASLHVAFTSAPEDRFVTTWEAASAGESITIPVGGAAGGYAVDWGDGHVTAHLGDATHAYDSPGNYTVQVYGDFERIHLGGGTPDNAAKLRSIDQWGATEWTTMEAAFEGASNMVYAATDAPDLSGVTDMSRMFFRASSFDGDISSWDVSGITDMSALFNLATSFNQPLDSWNTSSVTDMSYTFILAHAFNQPLDSWDTSSVTDMTSMFTHAHAFNQPIGSWDVSSVTDMTFMFTVARAFNQPLDSWNVSSVTDMFRMFTSARSFNQPLDSWDVSSVTVMSGLFSGASSFNQPLGSWDTSSVTEMPRVFNGATAFDGDISSWDTSSVTDMSYMFTFADSFNQPLDSWDVSSVTDMKDMFTFATSFDRDLGGWYVVLDDTVMDSTDPVTDAGGIAVTAIGAQNGYLDGQGPAYSVAAGVGDGDLFEVRDNVLLFVSDPPAGPASYNITIVSEGGFLPPNSVDVTITATDGPATAAVAGTVFADADGDGERDAGEAGIPGVRMLAVDLADQDSPMYATTGADGEYYFDMIRPAPATTLVQVAGSVPGYALPAQFYTYASPQAGQTAGFDLGLVPAP